LELVFRPKEYGCQRKVNRGEAEGGNEGGGKTDGTRSGNATKNRDRKVGESRKN